MAATNDFNPLSTSSSGSTVPAAVQAAPYPPSAVEAKCYYYGLPSRPLLVARSSTNVWVQPTGPEAYLIPKELEPIGSHPLQEIWEAKVAPAIVKHLDSKGVKWTSVDPLRIGFAKESPKPVIIWIGVVPGSLSAVDGIELATGCKTILSDHDINDAHVEIRESEVFLHSGPKMFKPALTSNVTAGAKEPFSTALGLPICAEATPYIEGTGGFFISVPDNLRKIYLVTARHVLFPPNEDSNELYQHRNNSGQPRKNVLLFGDAGIEKYIKDIELEIRGKHTMLEFLERRLESARHMDSEDAELERDDVLWEMEKTRKSIRLLSEFLAATSKDWKERENRILGHVVLSPPISFDVGEDGFMEDWAVIEIDNSKVDFTNFVGNVIDLGTSISVAEFMTWMTPHAGPPSFDYPTNRLLELRGTVSDGEVWKDSNNNGPYIMVLKRGSASGLTVGRLNTIRSFTKVYSKDQSLPGQMSKEIAVLPRDSKPGGAFAAPGDSGAAVVDGKGRIVGLLNGGAGGAEDSDCAYVTSINFILRRMLEHGLEANLSPSLNI